MLNMWVVLKKDNEMTTTRADTPGPRGRDEERAPASKYDEDEAVQQLGLNTSQDSERGARIGIGGPHRRNRQIQQSTR